MLIHVLRPAIALVSLILMTGSVFAASGYVFPDTAHVSFSWQISGDTVTAQLINQNASALQQTSFTDVTASEPTLLSCSVDGAPVNSVPVLRLLNSMTQSKYTTTWEIGDFRQFVTIRFIAPNYQPGNLSWMGFSMFPMFGMTDTAFTPGNCCVGYRGNIDNDPQDQVDIADLVYFVEYMFKTPPGPTPPCWEEADVTGDGSLDIADLVLLVEHMFGAPAKQLPACP